MSADLGELALGTFVPMLRTLRALLDKGAASLDPATMPTARLAPDMFPLSKQVVLACHWALDATMRLAGRTAPVLEDVEESLDASRARIARAVAALEGVDRAAFDGAADRTITVVLGPEFVLEMKGARYLRDWSLPHFYFHVVTAYDILRAQGVGLGKRDYLAHAGDAIRPHAA